MSVHGFPFSLGLAAAMAVGCASAPARESVAPQVHTPPPRAEARTEPAPAPAPPRLVDDDLPATPWAVTTPEAAALDTQVVEGLVREAEASGSDSLLVIVDGRTVVERYFDEPRTPIETMSVTKSVVALAILMLIADGRIESVDTPMSTWLPGWKKGKKASVTLRHVLSHTSGLEHRQGAGVLNQQADRTAFAIASKVVDEPGAVFSYNNEAVQLLAAVVEKAAGTSLDRYVDERLFAPLGITEWAWARDSAGNVQAFYGLALHARDLAKIGMFVLDGGKIGDRVVVPDALLAQATTEQAPGSGCGWLWWIRRGIGSVSLREKDVEMLVHQGAARAGVLDDLVGKRHSSSAALWLALAERTDDDGDAVLVRLAAAGVRPFEEQRGEPIGFAADGWLGQHLIVIPKRRLVAVRQHRSPVDREADQAYNEAHRFAGLVRWLELALTSSTPRERDAGRRHAAG